MNMAFELKASRLADIALQEASLDIWDKKYRLKTKSGEPVDATSTTPTSASRKALADVEATAETQRYWYERFLWALRRGAIPAGRITSNAGALEHKPATSTINCTVSGTIHDSMDDILDKVHEAGLTLKAGCGIGYEFSTLRPRGAYVSGAGAYTSGPLSFMDIYDKMCFTVSSAGGRRGAQMGTFDVGHPDAMEFIRAKREDGRLRQFNLSLLITDEFMEAVENDKRLAARVSRSRSKERGRASTSTDADAGRLARMADARATTSRATTAWSRAEIYSTLPRAAPVGRDHVSTYDFAEPGFILIDRVNEMNNNWWCENIRATNPCGEQPLPPYGSCLLGSVNLTTFVRDPFSRPGALRLGRIPRGRARLHAHARQRRRDQRPAARSSSATRSCASAVTAWASSASAPRSRCWACSTARPKSVPVHRGRVARDGASPAGKSALDAGQGERPGADHARGVRGHRRDAAQASGDGARRLARSARRLPGRVLHAKYSRYMQRVAEVAPELVDELAEDRRALHAPQLDRADRHDLAVAGQQCVATASSLRSRTTISAT